MKVKALALAWTCLLLTIPCSADIIYVKQGGTGTGTSWADAYGDLQDGLDDAGSGDEIWVSAGTYYPTYDYGLGIGNRGKHFRMINGVAIYGGFPPGGDMFESRDPNQFKTILSGDIGTVSDNSDNCYHVFYHPSGTNMDTTAILDGFTITAGNADDASPHHRGGGMYNLSSNPTVTSCTFTGNSVESTGGGMYNLGSSPTLTNCAFIANSAGSFGGGIENDYKCNPTVTNCTFIENSAGSFGGGMDNWNQCNPTVTNCVFSGNSADDGGGMANDTSNPVVTNCTFSGNLAGSGGGMYNWYNSNPTVTNCIIWGNIAPNGDQIYNTSSCTPIISYCDIAGCDGSGPGWDTSLGTDGGGNIDADPLFADPNGTDGIIGTDDDNLRLLPGSPCIDAADSDSVPSDTFDIDGLPRFYDDTHTIDTGNGTKPIVDMGAHEFIPCDFQPDGDIDDVDFIAFILYWLDTGCGRCGGADLTGEGDVDLADFAKFGLLWLAGVE